MRAFRSLRTQTRPWTRQNAPVSSTLRNNFDTSELRCGARRSLGNNVSYTTTTEQKAHPLFPPGPLNPLPIPLDHPAWLEGPHHEVRDRLKRASVEYPNMRSSHLCYPSPEEGLPELREELEKRPWGLVTYRTAYEGHSDRQFLKLRKLINDRVLKFLDEENKHMPMGLSCWPVVENKKQLQNVKTQVVREHFAKWAADRGVPPTEDGWRYEVARFHYCLIADRRVLKSADTTKPFVGVLYKDWLPAWHPDIIGDSGKYVPGKFELVEGNPDPLIGWFYLPVSSLIWCYDDMCVNGLWGKTYEIPIGRPPAVFGLSDLRRWRGDKAEGHYK